MENCERMFWAAVCISLVYIAYAFWVFSMDGIMILTTSRQ